MGQGIAVDGIAGLILISVPLVVVTLVAIWALRRQRKPLRGAGQDHVAPVPRQAVPAPPSAKPAAAPATPTAAPATRSRAPPAAKPTPTDVADLPAAIAKAEASGDKDALAHLYIRHAQALMAADDMEPAAARLRDAIRVAALNKLEAPHALARVELGDLYLRRGDPITACEQWQIARQLYHALDRSTDGDDVDSRMLKNGCPTDWVLTDF